MTDIRLSLDEVMDLALRALRASGADEVNAAPVARNIWRAERDGAKSHGLFRLPGYCGGLKSGKANGRARPRILSEEGSVIRLDADEAYYPVAHAVGLPALAALAKRQGLAALACRRGFHLAALWPEVETLCDAGLAAMAFTSTPPFVHNIGGTRKVFGTNPMAFGWPRPGRPPMIFDQAASVTARGEVQLALRDGRLAPEGAGIGPDGEPTRDPQAILDGAQSPFGGHKGAALALMVDLLAGPLIGEVTSLETGRQGDGKLPALGGQLILAFAPERLGGAGALDHGERLFAELMEDPGVRLPGDRRAAMRPLTPETGVTIPEALHKEILSLC